MSHRTQITLTDAQYERLRRETELTGVGLAALIRRAVDRMYGTSPRDAVIRAIDDTYGLWANGDDGPAAGAPGTSAVRHRLDAL